MIGILYDETSIMYCAPVKETFQTLGLSFCVYFL